MATFPIKFIRAQTCNISSKTFTEVTEYGMVSEVAKRGNPHKWEVEFMTTPLREEDARELSAFLDSLDGRYGEFTLNSPLRYLSGSSPYNPDATYEAGENVIGVTGLTNGKIGDFINFSNHDKTYKIVGVGGSNSSITIYPRLRSQIISAVLIKEAKFTLRLKADKNSLSLDARKGLYPVLISAIEA